MGRVLPEGHRKEPKAQQRHVEFFYIAAAFQRLLEAYFVCFEVLMLAIKRLDQNSPKDKVKKKFTRL